MRRHSTFQGKNAVTQLLIHILGIVCHILGNVDESNFNEEDLLDNKHCLKLLMLGR